VAGGLYTAVMKRWLVVVLFIVFGARGVVAQSGASTAAVDVQKLVDDLVKLQRTWGPETSTPGMSLTLNEEGRVESNSNSGMMPKVTQSQQFGTTLTFSLRVTGAPKDKTYSLVTWPVDLAASAKAPLTVAKDVTLDSHGIADRGGDQDHPLTLPLRPAAGEPVRVGLVSTDDTVKIFASIVPVPLEGKDHGCHISAVLLTRNAEVVMFEGSGFEPGADVEVDSVSGKEVRKQAKKADEKGNFMTVDLPFAEGQSHGNVKMTLKSGKCSPSVTVG
jgi:hypothetical protein